MPTIGVVGDAGNAPTGGLNGQVLVKNSATNFDSSWASPSAGPGSGNPIYVSGNYYTNALLTNTLATTSAIAADTVFYTPCWIGQAVTMDQVAIYCNSAVATNTLTVGVMTAKAITYMPSSVLNYTTVTITNSANAFVTFPMSVDLPAGWVWFVLQANGGTVNTINPATAPGLFRTPQSPIGTTVGSVNNWGYTNSGVPYIWLAGDPNAVPQSSGGVAPIHVFYRVA
jgi:hypothetical protein